MNSNEFFDDCYWICWWNFMNLLMKFSEFVDEIKWIHWWIPWWIHWGIPWLIHWGIPWWLHGGIPWWIHSFMSFRKIPFCRLHFTFKEKLPMNGTMTMTNVHPLLFQKVCILENERISKVFIFPKYPQAIFKCLQKLKKWYHDGDPT